ncbi:MAG: class I SAM-dependent methyltransferase [Proteobacteria bacterium]|nr:class I SAM-dependent methyltransferase [Pseudomonadota bacterium]MDA0992799.1 class I SAM-dependent methyltransferase [Pseudomonadota bacterium]
MTDRPNISTAVHQHSGGENLEVMREARKYNQYLRELIQRFAGDAKTALDFGAGIGTFSDSVDVPRNQIHCVEPDEGVQEHLANQGFKAHKDLAEVADSSIDYLFTLNVLEHIEDDSSALREIFRVVRPGGRLLIYVPAFMSLYTSMDLHVGHHRRYRMAQLVDIVEKAGFRVEKRAYFDALGFFATLLFKLFDSPEPAPLNSRMVGLYDRFVFPASRILSVPLARVLGKNVYVVASRPKSSSE